jgi:hypothetical protein
MGSILEDSHDSLPRSGLDAFKKGQIKGAVKASESTGKSQSFFNCTPRMRIALFSD